MRDRRLGQLERPVLQHVEEPPVVVRHDLEHAVQDIHAVRNHLQFVGQFAPVVGEGVPDELCATALLLLSDRLSPYTTGAEFVVDGGLRLRALSLETT